MIEGEKVRLRKVERTDLPLLHKWANDRDVVAWARFSPEHMTSLAALEKAYEKELHDEETERTSYMIEERASSKPIGWCVMRARGRKPVSATVAGRLGGVE